jgi:hypothetical protein
VVQNVVRSTLSLTFVIAAARVVFNVKGRMLREATWEMELKGDLTKQRRVEVGLAVHAAGQSTAARRPLCGYNAQPGCMCMSIYIRISDWRTHLLHS